MATRLEMLLLIHMLATLLAWLGAIASTPTHETRFKLSLLRRGWEYLRCTHQRFTDVKRPPWPQLQNLIASYSLDA